MYESISHAILYYLLILRNKCIINLQKIYTVHFMND